jgi:hypothetical protein
MSNTNSQTKAAKSTAALTPGASASTTTTVVAKDGEQPTPATTTTTTTTVKSTDEEKAAASAKAAPFIAAAATAAAAYLGMDARARTGLAHILPAGPVLAAALKTQRKAFEGDLRSRDPVIISAAIAGVAVLGGIFLASSSRAKSRLPR